MSNNYLPTDFQSFIHTSRYARWLDDEQRRENWGETVERYLDNVVAKHLDDASGWDVYSDLQEAITGLSVMPSMRAMMTAGPALDRDNTAGYNCSYLPVDDPKSFDEAMFILLCGTGVGFSVERQHVQKLPEVPDTLYESDDLLCVADSKEGWAKALRKLIAHLYAGEVPKWDIGKIRPAGAKLKTFGGRASGPGPLIDLFNFTVETFKGATGRKLSSLECHDLMCKIGEIVVVGGVRRSAMISLSNLSDDRMRHAKSGQFPAHRFLANNSVAYTEKPDAQAFLREWSSLADSGSGERGVFNRVASQKQAEKYGRRDPGYEFGTNPCCVSGDTEILTSDGSRLISTTVGEQVQIWNGEEWAEVEPYEAGVAELVRVTLTDGSYLDCTWNHRWVIHEVGFVETRDLKADDLLKTFEIPGVDTSSDRRVLSIKPLGITEMTYCFTEPKTSRGTFNGVVTGNSEIILRKVRLATILGTMQSTLTKFPYLRKIWQKNTEEERLLGVSLTGIMDNTLTNGKEGDLASLLDTLREEAVKTNKEWAEKLGIPQSTAVTCVKPSGTVSQLVDSASGIHARHSEYYIRTVRGDNKDPLTQFMKDQGIPNEPCVYKGDTTTVFSFPIKAPTGAVTRTDMSAVEQLDVWLTYQRHWCEHKPSVTVSVKKDEWLDVGAYVYDHFDEMSGVSFLPFDDHVYQQAPYQDATKDEYEALLARMPGKIDWSKLEAYEVEDTTKSSQTLACSGDSCEIVDIGA
jgi:hypothetical protein